MTPTPETTNRLVEAMDTAGALFGEHVNGQPDLVVNGEALINVTNDGPRITRIAAERLGIEPWEVDQALKLLRTLIELQVIRSVQERQPSRVLDMFHGMLLQALVGATILSGD